MLYFIKHLQTFYFSCLTDSLQSLILTGVSFNFPGNTSQKHYSSSFCPHKDMAVSVASPAFNRKAKRFHSLLTSNEMS